MYVSLEPCAHTGKTGPCTTLILENKIPRVFIGMQDPFSEVNGKGMEILRAKGVEVTCCILEPACRDLNKRFITFHEKKRPYIVLKWAVSADNFMGRENERVQISGPDAQVLLHKWRSEEMGILVGVNTAITDEPQLNVRAWQGRDPRPIILDGNLRADPKKFNAPIIFNYKKNGAENGIQFLRVAAENNIQEILKHLYENEIQSVLVEGGADVIQQFIEANAWDEIRVIHSHKLRLEKGIPAPVIDMRPFETVEFEHDTVKCYKNLIRE
jgi:diaminohydroxyphosphoribosylaminopyrimidine deaminase/5-amino-6-(5-phosphoribosylamino)uracil reductase